MTKNSKSAIRYVSDFHFDLSNFESLEIIIIKENHIDRSSS